MQAGDSGREHRGPDAATRLRLLSLQTAGGPFEFGGGLACVHTPPAARTAVAEEIARAVIGPRAAGVDGTLEIAGRYVALHSLPAPLLRPSAAATIDRPMLDDLWRDMCAREHAELAATHAARRLDRHRTDAAIERARERAARLAAAGTPPVAIAPPPAPEPAPVVDEVTPRLLSSLAALDGLHPIPSPDALALAIAFEELAATPPPTPEPIDIDLGELQQRVADARVAVAGAAGGVMPAARARIDQCHRAVVETERTLFEADHRKQRSDALVQYQEALGAERDALAEAGVDSYASFLVAITGLAAPVDLEERLRAELELAHAEATLEQARASLAEVADAREDAELELRAQAAQILGRFPGADPAVELRAVRIEHPGGMELRQALRTQLASIGVEAGTDVVADARATVAVRQAAPPPVVVDPTPVPPPAPPVAEPDDEELCAVEAEIDALLQEGADHDAVLAQMEAQLEVLDGYRLASFSDEHVDAVTLVLAAMLDLYRSAELLAGRLPIVVDGAFDELGARGSAVAANHLAAAADVQVIVVTSDPDVADAFSMVGAATSSWPTGLPSAPAPAVPGSHPAPPAPVASPPLESPIVTMCGEHAAKVAAAACSRCARPACVDCLVYMPDTADLWCVTCAEATGRRDTRLLGRA